MVLASNAVAACARTAAENRATELAMSFAHCSVMSGADAFCAAPPLKAGSTPFCSHVATASNKSISWIYASNASSAAMRSSSPNVRASSACAACSHGSDKEGEEEDDVEEEEDDDDDENENEEDDDDDAASSAEGRTDAVDAETGMDKDADSEATWQESIAIRGAKFLYDVGS